MLANGLTIQEKEVAQEAVAASQLTQNRSAPKKKKETWKSQCTKHRGQWEEQKKSVPEVKLQINHHHGLQNFNPARQIGALRAEKSTSITEGEKKGTISEPNTGLLRVDIVENTLVSDLALRGQADQAPDIRICRGARFRRRNFGRHVLVPAPPRFQSQTAGA